ncbi:CHAT domain protein [Proteus terrae]|uniref:CHAT domain protein n=1 Tax=Proteus terrae TaxID=1574161 RepID=UPI0034D6D2AB
MELLQEAGAILKVVIMPTTGEQTLFQGFDTGIISSEIADILFLLSKVPKKIDDIFDNKDKNSSDYLNSYNPIILISKENMVNIPNFYHIPFCVIFCTVDDFPYIRSLVELFDIPPIICCNSKFADIQLDKIDSVYSFDDILYSRIKIIEDKIGEKIIRTSLKKRCVLLKKSRWHSTLNNTTITNESLIESLGFILSKSIKIKSGSSKREFINIIIDSVDAYNECLGQLGMEPSSEILLYTPGMYSFLYDKKSNFYKLIGKGLNSDEKKFLINGVLRNPNYSGVIIRVKQGDKDFLDKSNNDIFYYFLSLRRSEMRLTTAAITLMSLNKNIPAIRLPNSINHYTSYLKKLEELAFLSGIDSSEFTKKAKAFNTIIRRIIGNKLRTYINKNYNEITFICDVPLDWIRFNNIPIMFSHEVSRINSTPGNVLLQNTSSFPRTIIKSSELKKVLIIRSFEPDDHLKFFLENAMEEFKKHMPELDCEIIDVRTKVEFIDALNQYDGFLLIVDCHGDHGGDKENGWLIIGDEKVDTWGLKKSARVPPIVILSACLTSALSGSHASVANGFLISGALSVIGTLLPVNAIDSAVFVSRLIYRIYQFPSAIKDRFTHVNVRLLFSTFLRISYVTDLIRGFEKEGLIEEDIWQEYAIEINAYINMLNHDWFDYTLKMLAKLTKLEIKDVIDFINEKLFITETMCYSQIGFPDSITISLRE